jgi:hypothetical protein
MLHGHHDAQQRKQQQIWQVILGCNASPAVRPSLALPTAGMKNKKWAYLRDTQCTEEGVQPAGWAFHRLRGPRLHCVARLHGRAHFAERNVYAITTRVHAWSL